MRTITIREEEYDQLVEDSFKLACLEEAGLQNWDGYEAAIKSFDPGVNNDK